MIHKPILIAILFAAMPMGLRAHKGENSVTINGEVSIAINQVGKGFGLF